MNLNAVNLSTENPNTEHCLTFNQEERINSFLKNFILNSNIFDIFSIVKFSSSEKNSLLDQVLLESSFFTNFSKFKGVISTNALSILKKHLAINASLNPDILSEDLPELLNCEASLNQSEDFSISQINSFVLNIAPKNKVLAESFSFWRDFDQSAFSNFNLKKRAFSLSENIEKQNKKKRLSCNEKEIAFKILNSNNELSSRILCLAYLFDPNIDERIFFNKILGSENIVLYFEKFLHLSVPANKQQEFFDSSSSLIELAPRYKELEEMIFLYNFILEDADNKYQPIVLLSFIREMLEVFYYRYNHPSYRPHFSSGYYNELYHAVSNIFKLSLSYLDNVLIKDSRINTVV